MPDILDPNQSSSNDSTSSVGTPTGGSSSVPPTPAPDPLPVDGSIGDLLRPGADAPKNEPIIPVGGGNLNPEVKENSMPAVSIPAPEPVVETPPPTASPAVPTPMPSEPPPAPVEQVPVHTDPALIVPAKENPPTEVVTPPTGGNPPKSFGHHGKGNKRNIAMGLAILFLLLTTGFVFVFVNQQGQVGDIRNRATGGLYDASDSQIAACRSGNQSACISICGSQPTAIQDTCVPPGVGCNMDSSQGSQNACTNWHWTNCIGGGTDGVGCGTGNDDNYNYSQSSYASYTYAQATYQTTTNTPTHTPTGTPTNTPTQTPTGTPSITPTGTPSITITATPTPTQIVYAACNYACTVNADCGGGLVCLDKVCRNASCVESATCSCGGIVASPTPKIPVAGTGPSVLGATTIAGGFLLLLLGLLF